MKLETTILKNLLQQQDYTRKVLPFLKPEYFGNSEDRLLYKEIVDFINKYNVPPSYDALKIEVDSMKGSTDDTVKNILATIDTIEKDQTVTNMEWLIDSTEKFCQERAIYGAITQSLEIMNGKGKLQKGAIPELLSNALSITFDPNVGHDYFANAEERYAYYHRVENRISFDLEFLNKITKGGVPRKTLNVIMAGVGVGKSLSLCHLSACYLNQGKNVLYITLELAQEEVAKRIDANLFGVTLDDLMQMPKDLYDKKIANLSRKTNGKLIVKEYPTTSASTTHFKALLNELNLKKGFVPDVIMVDYINICASARVRPGESNSYTYIKSIAEELRGLAVEKNVPLWTATQLTRGGYGSSDPDMTDTAESFGLPATADLFLAAITNEQLEQLNQIMFKQLKNRYGDPAMHKRFIIGVDRAKMKLYDVEQSAQDIVDTGNGGQEEQTSKFVPMKKTDTSKFKSLKV